jgi:hypothetical protein
MHRWNNENVPQGSSRNVYTMNTVPTCVRDNEMTERSEGNRDYVAT